MSGPTKPYDEDKVGQQVQMNYKFIDKLFGRGQKAFRDRFFRCRTEAALRRALKREGVNVRPGVRLMILDVENARTKVFGTINPRRDNFYVMVMPPVPRRRKSEDYKDSQAWEGAWYHAIVDSYGM